MAKIKAKKSEVVVETKKDIKKQQKKIKLQNQKDVSDTEQEVKRFVCILITLLIIIGIVYYITTKSNNNTNNNTIEIQYNDISVGMILNRNEYSEYYVLAYFDDSDNYNDLYKLYRTYRNREDVTKLYTVNLNDPINKDFITEDNAQINVERAENFKFKNDTLLYIKDGKVVKTYTTYKAIENILK